MTWLCPLGKRSNQSFCWLLWHVSLKILAFEDVFILDCFFLLEHRFYGFDTLSFRFNLFFPWRKFSRKVMMISISVHLLLFISLKSVVWHTGKFCQSFGIEVSHCNVDLLPAKLWKLHGLSQDISLALVKTSLVTQSLCKFDHNINK